MSFIPVVLPAGTAAHVEQTIQDSIDPILADVHSMLRLPVAGDPGLQGGCNWSATLVLLSVANGVAAELLKAPDLDKRQQPGERFRRLLAEFFPWDEEGHLAGVILGKHASNVLYDAFRNPLDHNLGVFEETKHGDRKLAKGSLSEDEVESIEKSRKRPSEWTRPTLYTDGENKTDRTKTVLTVKCLYWGIRRMIWRLVSDQHVVQEPLDAPFDMAKQTVSATATTVVTSGSTGASEYEKG